jgi:hypothetical protein
MITRFLFSQGIVENVLYVAPLTINQKDSLIDQLVQLDWYFNPILSGGTEPWIITEQEINSSIYPDHIWIKDLSLVEYNPPITPSGTTI